ncbi:MAG TPA: response regulator [Opitutaceae bacterium]|jgi:two-component system response regulator|nr:response regulator [Opitutaceae bacterium]
MERTILLVEDDPDDVFFFKTALRSAGIPNPVEVVETGPEALRYLDGLRPHGGALPALILLDLRLPLLPGLDVLREIRGRPGLRRAIVTVLTSSSSDRDIEAAYERGANSYIVKPSTVKERLHMAELLRDYWLQLNRGPAPSLSDSVSGDRAEHRAGSSHQNLIRVSGTAP